MKNILCGLLLIICVGCSSDRGVFRGWFDKHRKSCDECRDGELCSSAKFRLECDISDEYGHVPLKELAQALDFQIVDAEVEPYRSIPVVSEEVAEQILQQHYEESRK